MSLKFKVKEAFSNRNRLMKSKWSQQTQVNIYALDIFLMKSGYRLVDIILQKTDNGTVPELIIEPIKVSYLYPEITHSPADNTFYVHVKKYGELDASDLRGVMQGYENALAILDHLDSVDLSKLEIVED